MNYPAAISLAILLLCLFPSFGRSFCFEEAGRRYNISPKLLESIARVESGLNPRAVNRNTNGSTDMGLMQINSSWLKTLNVTREDLMNDACLNTMTGAWVLRQCINRHGYTWEAVGCYNAYSSQKRVNYAWKVFHKLKGTPAKTAGQMPAPRTRKMASARKPGPASSSSFVFRVRDASEMGTVSQ